LASLYYYFSIGIIIIYDTLFDTIVDISTSMKSKIKLSSIGECPNSYGYVVPALLYQGPTRRRSNF